MTDGTQINLFEQNLEGSQEFFTRKRSWSASKHRIMLRYLQSHCYNLGGDKTFQSMHINYVDGWAGDGKYDEGFGIEDFTKESKLWKRYDIDLLDTDGSPLIALKCAKVFQQEDRVNLRCFFAEANPKTNNSLQENCREARQGLDCKIYSPQSFDKVFPQIMKDLDGYPTVFFLDSYGVKGINFEQICLIGDYVSKHKGELFLLFHNRAVARHAGYLTQKSNSEKMKRIAETYMQNLTAMLGPNSDEAWKSQWRSLKDEPQQFERWALRYFLNRIVEQSKFKGVASFEIKENYNDPRPQYSLVVASNHPPKAIGEFLNEFFADENRLLFYEQDKNSLAKNFLDREWQRQVEQRKAEVKPQIIEILRQKNQDWRTVKEAITDVVLKLGTIGFSLGYLKRKEYHLIMSELYSEKLLVARSLGKRNTLTLESEIKIMR